MLGQSSIPVLNRNGYSMFWLSSWDDLHNYSTNLNEDAFLRNLFYFMVNDKYSSNFFLKKVYNVTQFKNFNFNKNLDQPSLSEFLFKANKIPYYISKVRIIKFQSWLVVYFHLYNYNKNLSYTKNDNIFLDFFKFSKKNTLHSYSKKLNYVFDF